MPAGDVELGHRTLGQPGAGVRDGDVPAVVGCREGAVEVQEADGDVELHLHRMRRLADVEAPCPDEADRDVGSSRVGHEPVYPTAQSSL